MNNKLALLSLAAAFALSGCGSDSSDNTSDSGGDDNTGGTVQTQTGVFLDAEVGNVSFETETQSGVTNDAGEFEYQEGEQVIFSIGELVFPATDAQATVTPVEILGASSVDDDAVVNMVRLLLSLDVDQDPSNGIGIPETAADVATNDIDFYVTVEEFENNASVQSFVTNGGQDTAVDGLVTAQEAVAHLSETLEEAGATPPSIVGAWYETERDEDYEAVTDVFLAFRDDGYYYEIEVENVDTGSGYEYGTYSYELRKLTGEVIADTNGDAGLSDAGEVTVNVGESTMVIVPSTDGLESTFTRIESDSSIVGGWQLNDGSGEEVLFIFRGDGVFSAVQATAEDGGVGIEYGTYEYSADNGTLTFDISVDTSGDTLASTLPIDSVAVDGDTMTITITGEGDVAFTRL